MIDRVGKWSQSQVDAASWAALEELRIPITAYLPDVRFGSFATGSSQQQVGPCPLCPDSDQILHLAEMTRWAISGLMRCNMIERMQTEIRLAAVSHCRSRVSIFAQTSPQGAAYGLSDRQA